MNNINITDIASGVLVQYDELQNIQIVPVAKFFAYNILSVSAVSDNILLELSGTTIIDEHFSNFVSPSALDAVTLAGLIFDIINEVIPVSDPVVDALDANNELLSDIRNFNYNYLYNSFKNAQNTVLTLPEKSAIGQVSWLNKFELSSKNNVGTGEAIITNIPSSLLFYSTPPTAASTLSIVSSSNTDRPASTGAYTLLVNGLDSSNNFLEETVVLNGTTPVLTVNEFTRVNFAKVATTGSSGTNVGNITITHATPSQSIAYISAGEGISKNGFISVADSNKLFIYNITISCDEEADNIVFTFHERKIGELLKLNKFVMYSKTTKSINFGNNPLIINELSDLIITGEHTGLLGTHNASVLVTGVFVNIDEYSNAHPSAVDTSGTTPVAYPASNITFSKNYSA